MTHLLSFLVFSFQINNYIHFPFIHRILIWTRASVCIESRMFTNSACFGNWKSLWYACNLSVLLLLVGSVHTDGTTRHCHVWLAQLQLMSKQLQKRRQRAGEEGKEIQNMKSARNVERMSVQESFYLVKIFNGKCFRICFLLNCKALFVRC